MSSNLPSIKALGPYAVILLVIIRFMIVPLHNSLANKKVLVRERQELLKSKQSLLQRQIVEKGARKPVVDKQTITKVFYAKDLPDTAIQADLVKNLIEVAEKKNLTVLNFELPDVAREKELSEVGAILRFKGQPIGMIELLRAIDDWPKPLKVKALEFAKSGADYATTLTVSGYRIER
jgi:adenylate kinase family enzyme